MRDDGHTNAHSAGQWRPMPLSIFFLGILSAILVLWTGLVNDERQRSYFLMNDAILDMQIHVTTAHLWLEEILTAGPSHMDINEVWNHFDEAGTLSDAILSGGHTHEGSIIMRLDDPKLRSDLEKIRTILDTLKLFAMDRFRNRATGGIGTEDDRRYNVMFRDFSKKSEELEFALSEKQASVYLYWRRFFWAVLFAWTFIVIFAAAALWDREDRRDRAEKALQMAREELELMAQERTDGLYRANAPPQPESGRERR
jgi:hypothetical protein